ncbi:MAG: sugar-transporting ATPase [Planctomycetaceae bacterium]|nr:sugar-transporting ATPase [Planctomycetaceae bacterium]
MIRKLKSFCVDYSMLLVLLGLCLFFAVATLDTQMPTGAAAADQMLPDIDSYLEEKKSVLVVTGNAADDQAFVAITKERLARHASLIKFLIGASPQDLRREFEQIVQNDDLPAVIVGTRSVSHWSLLQHRGEKFRALRDVPLLLPRKATSSNFLKPANLKNVAGQSAVFAIIAIGMTLVIITGGIDLSVGSLVALSAVTAAMVIRDLFGGVDAGGGGMMAGIVAAIAVCAVIGCLSGAMITLFGMPPFIVTLATMSIARGLAQILADGQSVYQIPGAFSYLAVGKPFGIPNEVIAMLLLYVFAHIMMAHTTLGRWFYAVGSNREAARLSGVPVGLVLMVAYIASGALAGVGGVLEASRLQSGSPLYGVMYELYVITAVVVGGTSLAGGEGKILGTLFGALAIAVIRNGMNLMNIESYTQGVVMGLLILLAVFTDSLKRGHIVAWIKGLGTRP